MYNGKNRYNIELIKMEFIKLFSATQALTNVKQASKQTSIRTCNYTYTVNSLT